MAATNRKHRNLSLTDEDAEVVENLLLVKIKVPQRAAKHNGVGPETRVGPTNFRDMSNLDRWVLDQPVNIVDDILNREHGNLALASELRLRVLAPFMLCHR